MYMVGAATGLDPMVAVHPLEVQEIIELSIPCCHALVPFAHGRILPRDAVRPSPKLAMGAVLPAERIWRSRLFFGTGQWLLLEFG